MAALSTIIAGVGLAAGAAGTAVQYMGAQKAAKGQDRAEKLRAAQMNLETQRQQRQVVRQATIARAQALSNASNQGAADGSGLQGGYGQVQGQAGGAIVANSQNQQLGQGMFAANRQISAGQTMSSIGSGISSLGGGLVSGSDTLGRIGNYAFGSRV